MELGTCTRDASPADAIPALQEREERLIVSKLDAPQESQANSGIQIRFALGRARVYRCSRGMQLGGGGSLQGVETEFGYLSPEAARSFRCTGSFSAAPGPIAFRPKDFDAFHYGLLRDSRQGSICLAVFSMLQVMTIIRVETWLTLSRV